MHIKPVVKKLWGADDVVGMASSDSFVTSVSDVVGLISCGSVVNPVLRCSVGCVAVDVGMTVDFVDALTVLSVEVDSDACVVSETVDCTAGVVAG